MIESGSFSGKYDAEKGVGKPRLEVLDDEAVLELIVDGQELFVPPMTSEEQDGSTVKKEQNRGESDVDFNDGPTLA